MRGGRRLCRQWRITAPSAQPLLMLSKTMASHVRSASAWSSSRFMFGCIAAVGDDGHGRQQAAPRRLDLLVGQPPVDAEQLAYRPRALAPRQADHAQRGAGIARRLDQSLGIDELAVGGRVGIGEGQPQAMHCASPRVKTMCGGLRRRQ